MKVCIYKSKNYFWWSDTGAKSALCLQGSLHLKWVNTKRTQCVNTRRDSQSWLRSSASKHKPTPWYVFRKHYDDVTSWSWALDRFRVQTPRFTPKKEEKSNSRMPTASIKNMLFGQQPTFTSRFRFTRFRRFDNWRGQNTPSHCELHRRALHRHMLRNGIEDLTSCEHVLALIGQSLQATSREGCFANGK